MQKSTNEDSLADIIIKGDVFKGIMEHIYDEESLDTADEKVQRLPTKIENDILDYYADSVGPNVAYRNTEYQKIMIEKANELLYRLRHLHNDYGYLYDRFEIFLFLEHHERYLRYLCKEFEIPE